MNATQIQLAREAVGAKVRYWDALRALETATASEGDWPDQVNDDVIEAIENLAGCAGDTADDPDVVSDEDIVETFTTLLAGA